MPTPGRGEVSLVDLGMIAKVRPALVVSLSPTDRERALLTICPHTTSVRGTQFEVNLPLGWLAKGAFDVQNLMSIPLAKFIRRLGSLDVAELRQIESSLNRWLGLSQTDS